MRQLRPDSALLRSLVDACAWSSLFLIDVGASGGISWEWQAFGAALRAVGFEPLIAEVDRLNRNPRPGVTYEAAFVGSPDYDRVFPPELRNDAVRSRSNDVFPRVSAVRAAEIMSMDYVRDVFNRGEAKALSDRRVSLDEYLASDDYANVDFLKIDTDGHDIEVLLGARKLLAHGVIGLMVELQLHGPCHEYANTFSNVDRYLRDFGFTMFDLEVYRYSRSALPAPFVYDIPAQTRSGQVIWGDALYLRDLADPLYDRKHSFEITRERVLKAASLFAFHDLHDCAAELLLNRRTLVGADLDLLLDLAAKDAGVPDGDYAAHIASFERDPRALYPVVQSASPTAEQDGTVQTPQPPGAEPQPAQRTGTAAPTDQGAENLLAENERLKAKLNVLKVKNERLRKKKRADVG